jgi:hypothetical protein
MDIMKIIEISNEVFRRSEIALAEVLDQMTRDQGFENYIQTFREAYLLIHGCELHFPPPIKPNIEDSVPADVWTLVFHYNQDATAFLLKYS